MAGLYQKFLTAQVPALIPICLTILSICLAILSFYLVVKNYRRKSGAYIRGSFTPCSSRYCNDEYVHEVVLENLKDRSVTIFGIYLRFGYNNYLEIEDFDDTPLTLKPFETYVKSYGPIEFYSMNCQKTKERQERLCPAAKLPHSSQKRLEWATVPSNLG